MQPFSVTMNPAKGVVTDISPDDLPEGFALDSLNGRFQPSRDGKSFSWIGVKGEKELTLTGDWISSYVFSQIKDFDKKVIAFVYDAAPGGHCFIVRLDPIF